MPRKILDPNLKANLRRMLKIHFLYIFALAIQIIVFDAGKLIEPVVVLRRWILVLSSLVVFTFLWYLMQKNNVSQDILRRIVLTLIIVDVTIASFYVYTQR